MSFKAETHSNLEQTIESVAALGQLTPTGETRLLAAPLLRNGSMPRISDLLVDEGDQVNVGQILAIFDNRKRVLADLELSRTRLRTVRSNISFQTAQISRYELATLEGASPVSLLEEMKDYLIRLKGKRDEIVSEINGLEIDLSYTELKSAIDGIVLRVNYRIGERPAEDGVLQVGSNNLMEALIEVYESDINKIKLDQRVTLISENGGFKGNLVGRVTQISPQIRQRKVLSTDPTGDADARIVEVRVNLDTISSNKVTRFTGMKVIARFQPF